MSTTSDMQAFLDSLSQVPGSILFRNANFWQALPPPDAGRILALDANLLPTWIVPELKNYPCLAFDGTGGTFTIVANWSGQQQTFMAAFSVDTTAGTSLETMAELDHTNSARSKFAVRFGNVSHPSYPNRLLIEVQSNTGAVINRFAPVVTLHGNGMHAMLWSHNAATGAAYLNIDGVTYTPSIATTGTLDTDQHTFRLGAGGSIGSSYWKGNIGQFGYSHIIRTNYTDFFDSQKRPKTLDLTTWTEWSSQPRVFSKYGDPSLNLGSYANANNSGRKYIVEPY